VGPLVGDVDVGVLVQGDGHGPDELARFFSIGAEFGDVLFLALADAEEVDAGTVRPRLIGPVHHVDQIVGAKGKVHRVAEPGALELGTAGGEAVGERPVVYSQEYTSHGFSPVCKEVSAAYRLLGRRGLFFEWLRRRDS